MNELQQKGGIIKMILQQERLNEIKKIIFERKTVRTDYLCKKLFFSISTIRRDLIELEKQGIIIRHRGCITLTNTSVLENTYRNRENTNKDKKIKICNIVSEYIKDGMSIMIDASSTATAIIHKIKERIGLIIITNNLKLAIELSIYDNIKTIMIGGVVKGKTFSTINEINYKPLDNYRADLAILSCRGISSDGVFEASSYQISIKRNMLQNSKNSILLCDSTKFNKQYFYKSSDFKEYKYFISDKAPNEELLQNINESGCKIIY